ncbi:MAG: DNA-binding response regulator [Phycisphaerales bacterium]|nr:DNA-binding response regulator [Phycisphaerales bacterium]
MGNPVQDKIRVVVADDYTPFRSGLRSLLAREAGIAVVGEAADAAAAAALAADLRPDVVIRDMVMPGLSGAALHNKCHIVGVDSGPNDVGCSENPDGTATKLVSQLIFVQGRAGQRRSGGSWPVGCGSSRRRTDGTAKPGPAGGRPGDARVVFGVFRDGDKLKPVALGLYPVWPDRPCTKISWLTNFVAVPSGFSLHPTSLGPLSTPTIWQLLCKAGPTRRRPVR